MIRAVSIAVFLCIVLQLRSQHTLSLQSHYDLVQRYRILPQSQIDSTGWVFALPSASFYFGNSGFSYNDIVSVDGDSASLDFDAAISQLNKQNYITAYASIPYFGVYNRYGDWQVNFHFAEVATVNLRYSKEMAEYLWKGNSSFIGQRVNLAPDFEALRYYESAVGASRSIGQWTFGATIKYLEGVSCISIQGNTIEVFTEPVTYNLSLNTDIEIHQSNPNQLIRVGQRPKKWFQNPGFAADLGISRTFSHGLEFHVSATNFGLIRWRHKVKTQSSTNQFEFSGIDAGAFLFGDSLDVAQYEDSLSDLLKFKKTKDHFTSYTLPRFQIGMSKVLNEKLILSGFAQVHFMSQGRQLAGATSLIRGFQYKKQLLDLGLHYSYRNRSPFSIGLSTQYTWRWFQLYFLCDNLFSWMLPKAKVPISLFDEKNDDFIVIPKSLRNINFHLGFNVLLYKS